MSAGHGARSIVLIRSFVLPFAGPPGAADNGRPPKARKNNAVPRLVPPHASPSLNPRMPQGEQLAAERARANALRRVRLSSREKGDLVMLGIGGFTPLEGFMSRADWEGVCDRYRTEAGV